MQLEYDPVILPFVISLLITAGLAAYAVRQPGAAARTFALLMLLLTIWILCYVLELSSVMLPGKMFWLKAKYVGSGPAPAVWFIFAVLMTNGQRLLNLPVRLATGLWVGLTWLVVLTNDLHHWMWTAVTLAPGLPESQAEHGPYFLVYATGIYLYTLLGAIIYFRHYRTTPAFFRRQATLLVLGGLIPLIGRMPEDLFGVDLIPKVDNVIFLFLVSGVLFALALFRYSALTLVPIARNLVVQNISAGIIVVDILGRVVDLNPYAQSVFATSTGATIGKMLTDIFAGWPDLAVSPGQDHEIAIPRADGPSYYSVQSSIIKEPNGTAAGQVLVLFDTTARKLVERQLERLARTDALTGVTNRRYFFELAETEVARAQRHGRPLAVLMLDVDHFKAINDTYGHQAGDSVLRAVAAVCQRVLRTEDLFARYGGEEFICLLSECASAEARATGERLRQTIEAARIDAAGQMIAVTLSIGVAYRAGEETTSLEQLLGQADSALYQAKASGRNRVLTAG